VLRRFSLKLPNHFARKAISQLHGKIKSAGFLEIIIHT
jgi:hypothetical protein